MSRDGFRAPMLPDDQFHAPMLLPDVGPPDLRTPEQTAASEAVARQRRARAMAAIDAARSAEVAQEQARAVQARDRDVTSPRQTAYELLTQVAPEAIGFAGGLISPEAETAAYNAAARGGRAVFGAVDAVAPASVIAPIWDREYSPEALAGEAVPFSDEATGALDSAINHRPLHEAMSESSDRRADVARRYPGSAMAGQALQGVALGPMFGAPGGAATNQTMGQAVRQGVVRGVAEGAPIGGLMAADSSEHSPVGEIADWARAPSWEQAGHAAAETGRFMGDTAAGAAQMSAAGGVLGGMFGAGGQVIRNMFGGITRPGPSPVLSGAGRAEISGAESVSDDIANAPWQGLDESAQARLDPEIFGEEARRAPIAITPEQNIGRLESPFRADPNIAHLRAAGLTDRRQLRAAENIYGAEGLANRLNDYGILRRGEVVPQSEVQRRARELQAQAGQALQDIYSDFGEHQIDMRQAVDEINAIADRLESSISPEEQALAQSVRRHADLIMERPGNIRTPRTASLTDTIDDPVARAMAAPPERPMSEMLRTQQMRAPSPDFEPIPNDQFPTQVSPAATMRRGPAAPAYEGTIAPEQPPEGPPVFEGELPPDPNAPPMPYEGTIPAQADPFAPPEMDVQPVTNIRELNNAIRARDQADRDLLSGSATGSPTIARRVGREVRSVLNRTRDRAVQGRYSPAGQPERGEEALGTYRRLRDLYATTAHVAPPGQMSVAEMSAPTLSRRVLGGAGATTGATIGGQVAGPVGAAAGGLAGGAVGYAAGNALREYEWSILAALNNRTGTTAEAVADIAGQLLRRVRGRPGYEAAGRLSGQALIDEVRSVAERVGDEDVVALSDAPAFLERIQQRLQTTPEAFGEYAQPLIDAVRRGELPRVLQALSADPQAQRAITTAADNDDTLDAELESLGASADGVPTFDGDDDALGAEMEALGIAEPEATEAPDVIPGVVKTPPANDDILPNVRKLRTQRGSR